MFNVIAKPELIANEYVQENVTAAPKGVVTTDWEPNVIELS